MNELTNVQLKRVTHLFDFDLLKSRCVEWEDLEWDYSDDGEPIANFTGENFEFEGKNFFCRVDVSVSFAKGKVDINVSQIKDVFFDENEASVTEKQAGFLLFKCHQYLTNNF